MKRQRIAKEAVTHLLLQGLTREEQNELMSILKEARQCLGISHSEFVDRIMLIAEKVNRSDIAD